MRHSLAHLLAVAVLDIFPDAKLGMGPAIENGFYYDFELPRSLTPDDLPALEKKMRELAEKKLTFKKAEWTRAKALKFFKGQSYKKELIKDIDDKKVSVYTVGKFTPLRSKQLLTGFTDLCKGPHVKSTKEIPADAFQLTRLAGAYWKGSEKNKMLQRVYGVAFAANKQLKAHLKHMEDAAKHDHRKLGPQLDLFCFSDLVGSGLPLYTPRGMIIIDELRKRVEKVCRDYGFAKVMTPHIAKIDLFKASGHAQKFADELIHVKSRHRKNYVMKPVQCPHQTQIYASKPRSYRDLPIRYMESNKQYRDEKPGEVGGLNRVIAITVEDGHSFCRVDQVKDEVKNMVKIIKEFYSALGLWGNHWVSLSVRDKDHPKKYIGQPKDWDKCERMLKEVADEMKLDAKRREGEAALYGPKLDFMFRDSTGREIQIPTVQLDFATPQRFNLVYTNEKGEEKNPVMVHRAILGSYERLLALLIEHFGGAFPVWLAPVQAQLLPIGEKHRVYAKKTAELLQENDVRTEVDESSNTIGKKIREGELQKIPYLLIVGDKEITKKTVSVRERGRGNTGAVKLETFIKQIQKKAKERE